MLHICWNSLLPMPNDSPDSSMKLACQYEHLEVFPKVKPELRGHGVKGFNVSCKKPTDTPCPQSTWLCNMFVRAQHQWERPSQKTKRDPEMEFSITSQDHSHNARVHLACAICIKLQHPLREKRLPCVMTKHVLEVPLQLCSFATHQHTRVCRAMAILFQPLCASLWKLYESYQLLPRTL